ncbi:MAG TPA: DUF2119 family protein, partial [Methanosarcina sp.]|nr:DUF2119 family protein [Methanosarcina sp.]
MKANGIKDFFSDKPGNTETAPKYVDIHSDSRLDGYSDWHTDSEMKIYGSGNPVRLFTAGMHGEEWKDTSDLLANLKPPKTGTMALIPLVSKGNYISTLDPNYYYGIGKKVLE